MVGDIRLSERQDDRGVRRLRRTRLFSLAGIVDQPAIGYRRRRRPASRFRILRRTGWTTDRARRDRCRQQKALSGQLVTKGAACAKTKRILLQRANVAGNYPAAHARPGIATRDHYDTKPQVPPRFDRTKCRLAGVQPAARQRLHPRDGGRDPRRHRRGAGRSRGARAGAGKRRPALLQRRRRPACLQGHRPGRMRRWAERCHQIVRLLRGSPSRRSPPSTARPWAAGWRRRCIVTCASPRPTPESASGDQHRLDPADRYDEALARLVGRPRALRYLYDGSLATRGRGAGVGPARRACRAGRAAHRAQADGEELAAKSRPPSPPSAAP